jgi:hypothetical protein
MAVTIGELLVNLRASTASFAKDLDKASQLSFNTSREIERSFQKIGAVVATELTAATAAITASVTRSIDAADQMGKLAQKTGLTTEQFSGLAYAAKITDVPLDTLSKSFVILSKNLEKSNEQTLEGKAAHSALATLFQGSIPTFKDTNEAFEQITAHLAVLPDGFQKTALAAQIFGKSGAQLIPLINQNVDGIKKLVAEAQSFGVVISQQTARDAQQFNETVKRITTAFEGLSLQLAQHLLPYLQALADQFLASSKDAQSLNTNVEAMANLVKIVATGAVALVGALKVLGAQLAQIITAIEVATSRELTMAERWAELKQSEKNVDDAIRSTVETIQNLWVPALTKSGEKTADVTKKHAALNTVNADLAKTYEEIVKKLEEEITRLTLGSQAVEIFKLQTLGASQAQIHFVETLNKTIAAIKNHTTSNDDFIATLDTHTKLVDKLDDSYQKLIEKGFEAWEKARTPLEKYSKDVFELKVLLDAHIIDQETVNRLTEEWGKQAGLVAVKIDHMQQLSKDFQKSIGQAFESAIIGARSFTDILKSLLTAIEEAILRMLVFKSIADALSGKGGFLGFIGGIFGSIAGGGKAKGGPVYPGMSYTVGENGPETFYPIAAGTIVPNKEGGGTTIYQIDARGADPSVEFRIRRAIAESENRAVARAVLATREMGLRTN